MLRFLSPPPPADPLPPERIDETYRILRWKVFAGIFIGYAGYYLVRKNFSLAMPDLILQGYSKTELGFVLSLLAVSYGLSKFLMGSVSDRSNARVFMPLGLILSAFTMMTMGLLPVFTSSLLIMSILMFLNGWFQGMGWPPAGRTMVHWFSVKERGTKMSIWNLAHNVGGGLMAPIAILGVELFVGWQAKFYFPGMVAIVIALVTYFLMRSTPQSEGLPTIEKWTGDYPPSYNDSHENTYSAREIFTKYILPNKLLWSIALANAFVYLIRYGISDWAPTYLQEIKGFDFKASGWAYSAYEFAGIPGTLLCGWLSDAVFKGKRAPVTIIYMTVILVTILIYWFNPAGNPTVDFICLIAIGFLIYGPVMLIGVHALDLVPKNAAGTSAGFTGLFGYFIGTALLANILCGYITENFGWNWFFAFMILGCVLSIVFTALTLKNE